MPTAVHIMSHYFVSSNQSLFCSEYIVCDTHLWWHTLTKGQRCHPPVRLSTSGITHHACTPQSHSALWPVGPTHFPSRIGLGR